MSNLPLAGQKRGSSVHLGHLVLVRRNSLLAGEESLSVLVKSKLSDLNVGWVDWNLGLLTVDLGLGHFLDVNAPFSAVNFSHLAFLALAGSALDLDSVSVADWDAAGLILFS